jgi:hypothetical protein
MINRARIPMRSDDLSNLLPLGQLQRRAFPGLSYDLAFTPGKINLTYKRTKPDGTVVDLLPDSGNVLGGHTGGYVDLEGDGHWWVPVFSVVLAYTAYTDIISHGIKFSTTYTI